MWGGGDSLSMPIGEVYIVGDIRRVYITEWVFSREDKSITQPLVEMAISSNKVQEVRFESNNGGSEYAEEIGKRLRAQGYPCRMTWGKAPSTTAKASKIRQYAPDIKTYFYFLDREHQSSAYKRAFTELTSWLITGKSIHDDAPDSLSGLSEMILGNRIGIVTAGIDRNRYRL
jgi:predicted phage terminase large subunit-like protein